MVEISMSLNAVDVETCELSIEARARSPAFIFCLRLPARANRLFQTRRPERFAKQHARHVFVWLGRCTAAGAVDVRTEEHGVARFMFISMAAG